ncbi:MAG: N-acetylglucosamine kinase [Chitinophagales bacterium]
MLLIADSGGTKTSWAFVETTDKVEIVETEGIHPYFQDSYQMSKIIWHLPEELIEEVTELQFYGAGCGARTQARNVQNVLSDCFPDGAKIKVDTDVFGAARALCQHEAGIAGILGTGSNTCRYDGRQIIENSRGFGFILGDEGSGAVMGKRLMVDYLYQKMPLHLLQKLERRLQLTPDKVLEHVYKKTAPNRYLAKFSYFIHEHRKETYVQELLQSHFEDFFRKRILVFEGHQNLPLHLIGSIAFHFQAEIKKVAAQFDIELGKILQNPMQDLIQYHLSIDSAD